MIKGYGKIIYDPEPKIGSIDKMFQPWWAIVSTEDDIAEYYTWFLKKRTGLIMQKPAWGSHISIIRGEEPLDKTLWRKYHSHEICFDIDTSVRTNGTHWWLKVHSPKFEHIRTELGLPKDTHYNMHLTLGKSIQSQEESSNYFHRYFYTKTN